MYLCLEMQELKPLYAANKPNAKLYYFEPDLFSQKLLLYLLNISFSEL